MGLGAHTSPNDGIEHGEWEECRKAIRPQPSILIFCVALAAAQSRYRLSGASNSLSQESHSDVARAVNQDRR
jgi:hypothetical protein